MEALKKKIEEKKAKIAIVGVGYVGLPLAVEFAKANFTVTGIDVVKEKVDMINQGISYIEDVKTEALKDLVKKGKLKATTRNNILNEMDFNEEAISSYNKAVKIRPDCIEAWNNRGIVLNKIGKIKEAIKSYNRAIKINSNYYEAYLNLGLAQDNLNRYKQAIQSYQKFIELAPSGKDKYIKITKRRISEIKDQLKSKTKKSETRESGTRESSLEIQLAEES